MGYGDRSRSPRAMAPIRALSVPFGCAVGLPPRGLVVTLLIQAARRQSPVEGAWRRYGEKRGVMDCHDRRSGGNPDQAVLGYSPGGR